MVQKITKSQIQKITKNPNIPNTLGKLREIRTRGTESNVDDMTKDDGKTPQYIHHKKKRKKSGDQI